MKDETSSLVPTPKQNLQAIHDVLHQHAEGAITFTEMFAQVTLVTSTAWSQMPSSLELHADSAQGIDTPDAVAYLKEKQITIISRGVHVQFIATRGALQDMLTDLGFLFRTDFVNEEDFQEELLSYTSRIEEVTDVE